MARGKLRVSFPPNAAKHACKRTEHTKHHYRRHTMTMAANIHILARRLFVPRADIKSLRVLPSARRAHPFSSTASAATSVSAAAASRSNGNSTQDATNCSIKPSTALLIAGASLVGGYCLGSSHSEHWNDLQKNRELPKGERGCCSCDASTTTTKSDTPELTEAQIALSSKLQKIVGKDHVYDGTTNTSTSAPFLKGARLGNGKALCIVQPRTLREAVKCLQEIVDAGCVVLPQGSNTGLTGG